MVDLALLNRCRRMAEAAASVVMAASLAALSGWALDIELLRALVPGMTPMNPMTAVLFLLACLALWRHRLLGRPGAAARLVLGCGAVLVFVSTTRLLGYLTPLDLGIDRLLFAARLDGNQMAPNTATNFLLLGLSLALVARGRSVLAGQVLVTVSSTISFMALLGYVYQVPLFGLPGYVPMAFHVSLCFLLVETGLLASSADGGFVAMLMSQRSGGKAARRLLPAVLVLPAVLGGLGILGMRHAMFAPEFAVALMATFCSVGLAGLMLGTAGRLNDGDAEVERLLSTDMLTGVMNRRTILEVLGGETASCLRYRVPLCTAMVDIDHFKHINDNHGHAAGDEVLRRVGSLIQASLRATDSAGRYGGEEFVVVLPHTGSEGAFTYAERLRSSIAAAEFALSSGEVLRVTCSIGIAQMAVAESPQPDQALAHADEALYLAKRSGRNRVQLASALPATMAA
ncbi:diguanylate cyclase [Pelomonas sp. KK5]|uniref:GGDEF domain-containing protein n=1 Tax=Pelomonas sp. KK5 TaxID=1855730 RepID=UPI00097C16C6|nr:GGDEF domain-containing protein [Pelomonas sp. KK5]